MTTPNVNDTLGKYVISKIDGNQYCRKNGSFLKHLISNGYNYESYYTTFYGNSKYCVFCGVITKFVSASMKYRDTCGSILCRNKQISKAKQSFTDDQWEKQRDSYRTTIVEKGDDYNQTRLDKCKTTTQLKCGLDHPKYQLLTPNAHQCLTDPVWMHTQHVLNKKTAVKISQELDCGITTATNWLHRHDIDIQRFRCSQTERDVVSMLKELDPNINIRINDRTIIAPLELDIYLPDYNLAIEINGIYWHGELNGKTRAYHINKTKACTSVGVRLLHIMDSEYIQQRDIVKSRISNMLGLSKRIYARQCNIVSITSKQSNEFLEMNHIQGASVSPYAYGLMYKNQMVAVMTFAKSRYNKLAEYELIRYTNIIGTSVVGGSSKLLTHFKRMVNPNSIITYSDRRWNTGNMYQQIGFKYLHTSSANYHYFRKHKPLELFSRQKFQKHKLSKLLDKFDPLRTEWQNMVDNGYDRIWDCGNDVWLWLS